MTCGFQDASLRHRHTARTAALASLVAAGVGLGLGCSTAGIGSFLSPGFVDLVDPDGLTGLATLDNSPGHVAIVLVNNTEVDERLLNYLQSAEGGGLTLTPHELSQLRARVRMRIDVTFTNGNMNSFEFVSGSANLVDQRFDTLSEADLVGNDLETIVVLCDVASVELRPQTNIEVFIPVEIRQFEVQVVDVGAAGGTGVVTDPILRQVNPIGFRPLLVDVVDNIEDLNVVLFRNIDPREFTRRLDDPQCGSVIKMEVDGVLKVPFDIDDTPSFDMADVQTEAGIGGRFTFRMNVLD